MKTKLQILVSLVLFFSLAMAFQPVHSEEEAPVVTATKELPSNSYLKREKRSIASDTDSWRDLVLKHGKIPFCREMMNGLIRET